MKFVIIKINSEEWNKMWNILCEHPLNVNLSEPNIARNESNGEIWEYMGSFIQNNETIHEFTHRSHPLTQTKITYKIKGSDNLSTSEIEKEFNIK